MLLTFNELRAVMPRAPLAYVEPLNQAMAEFSIDNPDRIAAFLANIAHESTELTRVSEGLDYTAERLAELWPVRFPSIAFALPYAHNPEKLANHLYANRLGNGDETSGDGWRYRGAGAIQLTGAANQQPCAAHFGIAPADIGDWLRTPEGACRSAAWFWWTRGLSTLADAGQFAIIVRRIVGSANPKVNGMADRLLYLGRAKTVLA